MLKPYNCLALLHIAEKGLECLSVHFKSLVLANTCIWTLICQRTRLLRHCTKVCRACQAHLAKHSRGKRWQESFGYLESSGVFPIDKWRDFNCKFDFSFGFRLFGFCDRSPTLGNDCIWRWSASCVCAEHTVSVLVPSKPLRTAASLQQDVMFLALIVPCLTRLEPRAHACLTQTWLNPRNEARFGLHRIKDGGNVRKKWLAISPYGLVCPIKMLKLAIWNLQPLCGVRGRLCARLPCTWLLVGIKLSGLLRGCEKNPCTRAGIFDFLREVCQTSGRLILFQYFSSRPWCWITITSLGCMNHKWSG